MTTTGRVGQLGRQMRCAAASATGQATAEFALLLPTLALVVMGLLDFGRLFHTYTAATNAAREGARYCSLYPYPQASETVANARDRLLRRVVDSRIGISPPPAGPQIAELGALWPQAEVEVQTWVTDSAAPVAG